MGNKPLKKTWPFDLGFLLGVGLIVFGVYMIHRPTAFIVGGLILAVISILAALPENKNAP